MSVASVNACRCGHRILSSAAPQFGPQIAYRPETSTRGIFAPCEGYPSLPQSCTLRPAKAPEALFTEET